MKKMNKILKIIGFMLSAIAVLALLSFVGSKRSSASCEELIIHIYADSGKNLVTEADVKNRISNKIGVVIGESLRQINTRAIETELRAIPFVRTAKVYETINKKLIVELKERKPMARLIDKKGNTAILDSEGF